MKTNLSAVVAACLALVSAGASAQPRTNFSVVTVAGLGAASFPKGTAIAQASSTNLPPDAGPTPRAKVPTARVETPQASVPAPAAPCEIGCAEARRDLRLGLLRLKGYGLASRPSRPYTEGLRTPVEVPVQAVAGCVVTEELIEQVRGYNAVMETEIQRHIRNGTLDRAVSLANATNRQEDGSVLLPGSLVRIEVHTNPPPIKDRR